MMLKSVDLPQPLGPMTETNSPRRTLKETPVRADISPDDVSYRLPTASSAKATAGASGKGTSLRVCTAFANDFPLNPEALRPRPQRNPKEGGSKVSV